MAQLLYNMLKSLPNINYDLTEASIHSITIGDKNTYTDFGMVPSKRPYFPPPEPVLNIVDVPGSDISLDYTESLTGSIHYKRREGSWTFYVIPSGIHPQKRHRDILAYFKGQKRTIVLSDDPEYTYTGRVWVGSYEAGERYSTCTLKYNVDPWAKKGSGGD